MAEFEDKLNAILGDPEAMGQIVSIAKALSGGGEDGTPDAPAQEETTVPNQETPAPDRGDSGQSPPDLSGLLSMLGGLAGGGGEDQKAAENPFAALGGLDPRLIQTVMTLFSEYSATDNRKVALLTALKPFVRPERYAKVDKAIQIAKLSRVIRVAFQLFRQEGGSRDV